MPFKKTIPGLLLAAGLLAVSGVATSIAAGQTTGPSVAISSPVGKWHTIDDKDGKPRGIIEITEKNGLLEGRIAGTLRTGETPNRVCTLCPGERRGQQMLGLLILSGLKREGQGADTVWSGGEILDPDSGKIYRARVHLEDGGRTLSVRGYLGVALLGRTQRWHRAP
jgi:uncharacterized protein (DUF2147 family)